MRMIALLLTTLLTWTACQKEGDDKRTNPPPPVTPPAKDTVSIRGVWITTTASTALNSRDNIRQTVANCKASGIRHLYVVVYNNAGTTYPSEVMFNLIGRRIKPEFAGRDPLQELIEEAHAAGLKVHAWFEYGFAASYQANGGPIVQAKPEWAGIDRDGLLVTKNGFDWLNAFHPDVQQFMIDLFREVVTKYDVDGVQGDDRLPAMPTTGGYDEYTIAQYKLEHNDQSPPYDYKNAAWVKWRANRLTQFLGRLRQEVKALKPSLQFSLSPSVYPFSLNEYLQDWPVWLDSSYADALFPQVYRYDINAYSATLQQLKSQVEPKYTSIVYPGVLLKSGSYVAPDGFLTQMIQANRRAGFKGEVFFFYEGVKDKLPYFKLQYANLP